MNRTATSINGTRVAVSAMLAAVAFLALALAFSGNAKASTAGDPISPEFNYVGLAIGTSLAGDVDELVLEPPTPAIGINGTYTDGNGNFSVPKEGGLNFPPVTVDLDLLEINGEIELTKAGSGHFDEATGDMDLDLSLALTLGVDDIAALAQEIGIALPGEGPLACQLAPLDVSLSTKRGWPHAGSAFADKENLEDGAVAGYWRAKPGIKAVLGSQQVCGIIGNLLLPVGGLWLANHTGPFSGMPAATETKPKPETCAEHNLEGNFPDCHPPQPDPCPEGFEGTPPDNCTKIQRPAAAVLTVNKKNVTAKAGKKVKIKVTIKNTGDKELAGKVAVKSNNKKVKATPKSVSVKVAGGGKVTKTITVKVAKKAKGKAVITAKIAGKSVKTTVKIKAVKKKKKRR